MTHRRRANAFTDDNPFVGGGPANAFSPGVEDAPQQKPVTTRPRGGDVEREVEVPLDQPDMAGIPQETGGVTPPSTEARRRLSNAQPMTPCMWCDGEGPDFTRSNGLQDGRPCEDCGGTGQVPSCIRGCGNPAPAGEACYQCKIHDVMGSRTMSTHKHNFPRQATVVRPHAGGHTVPKVCFGCGAPATFEVFNGGEPDEFACDDHVGSLAGNAAKREREKLGRDRWATRRRAFRDLSENRAPRSDTGNNPGYDESNPRAEDRAREGQNYDTGWRGERKPPYYEPLAPIYPRPGDEPENVEEYPGIDVPDDVVPDHLTVRDARRQAASGDPYDMTARRGGTCSKCSRPIEPGDHIIWWPRTRTAEHYECGREGYEDSQWAIMEEDMLGYTGQRQAQQEGPGYGWDTWEDMDSKDPDDQYDECKKCKGMGDDCSACFGLGIDPMPRSMKKKTSSITKVSIRCADCGQQGKIALEQVTDATRCRCGSPAIDFTDRVLAAQEGPGYGWDTWEDMAPPASLHRIHLADEAVGFGTLAIDWEIIDRSSPGSGAIVSQEPGNFVIEMDLTEDEAATLAREEEWVQRIEKVGRRTSRKQRA